MASVELQLPVDRPTLKGAQEHKALSRVRKTHDEYLKVVEASEAEGIDVLTKLKSLGFQRIEDFYLSCPHFGFVESTRHLGELGSGYVCFFDFVKFVCILLLMYFGINCFLMFAVYTPDKAEAAKLEWGDGELISSFWRTPWVLGRNSIDIRPIVVFLIIFLLTVIAVTIYEGRQKKLEADIDSELTFPDDYAVLVRGLPTKGQAADEVDIKTFFEDYGQPGAKTQVVKVVIGWDMKQFNDYNNACAGIMKQVQSLQERGVHAHDPKMVDLQDRLSKIRDSLLSVREGTETELQSSGVAIVSFRFQSDHREVLRWWNGRWMRLVKLLRIPDSLPKYKGKHAIQVERAPHPDEILWMDLAQPSVERWKRWCFSCFWLLVMLCVSVVVYFFVEKSERQTGKWWYSVLAAGVIASSNMLLIILCRFLSSFEFHDTVGDEISALIWKMSLVMVLNTIGLPLFVNYWYDQTLSWYTKSGLVYDISLLIIVNPIFQAIILRVHIFYRYRQLRVYFIDIEKTTLPKKQYYKFHEPDELDLPSAWASVIKFLTLGVFYMPIFPLAPAISIIGIVLFYLVTKYMVIAKYKRPAATAGRSSAETGLKVAATFLLFAVAIGHWLFLRENYGNGANRNKLLSVFIGAIVVIVLFHLTPFFVRRVLCCSVACFRKGSLSDTAGEADYYTAQYLWQENRTYHKVQPLYRHLPESYNPRYLACADVHHAPSMGHLRNEYRRALTGAIREESTGAPTGSPVRRTLESRLKKLPSGEQFIVASACPPHVQGGVQPLLTLQPVAPISEGAAASAAYAYPSATPGYVLAQPGTHVAQAQPGVYVAQAQPGYPAGVPLAQSATQAQPHQEVLQGLPQQGNVSPCVVGCGRYRRQGMQPSGSPYDACCQECTQSHGGIHSSTCGMQSAELPLTCSAGWNAIL